ncbi:MAG TPA: hypothetical protein VFJ82_12500 [Longimicrobium sp.]|nr:hypothetical protein [Longimicrobium sp.]
MIARSADPLADVEYAAAFEFLRYAVRTRLAESGSVAALARHLVVEPRELRRFLAGERPGKLLWDALTPFTREHPEMADSGMVGLALIVDRLPLRLRRRARTVLASTLDDFLREHGQPRPPWLEWELSQR